MKRNVWNGVEYLTFPALEETGVVKHLFSTRIGGVSEGIFATMNLSYFRVCAVGPDAYDECAQGDGGGQRKGNPEEKGLQRCGRADYR